MPTASTASSTIRGDDTEMAEKVALGTSPSDSQVDIEDSEIERVSSQNQETAANIFAEPEIVAEADMEKGGVAPPKAPGGGAAAAGGPPPGFAPADFPDGGADAWMCVFGGFLALFCTFGLVNCVGVFLQYYVENPLSSYSESSVAWITSCEVFIQTGTAAIWGRVFDNYGPRWLLLIGTVLYVFAMMMVSLSTEYYQFFLAQGILGAAASGAVFNGAMTSTTTWFFKRRAAAIGIVASGSSLGGVCLPIMLNHLIPKVGFPWTMRILGFMFLGMCGIACATVKSRLPPRPKPLRLSDYTKPFRELTTVLTFAANFLFFWGMFLPFSYITLQAEAAGMDPSIAQYLLSILNAVSIFGRIGPAYLGDKIGRYNTMIVITLLSGIFTLALWIPGQSTAAIIVYGIIFGFTSGGFISLMPACIAQISDIREIGLRTGLAFGVQSFGALTGPPIGGALITDTGNIYLRLQLFCGVIMTSSVFFYIAARYSQVGFKLVKF